MEPSPSDHPNSPESPTPSKKLVLLEEQGGLNGSTRALIASTLGPLIGEFPDSSTGLPDKTFRDLQWDQIRNLLCEHAHTAEGRYALEYLIPPPDRACVELRLEEVSEVMELLETDAAPPLGGVRDIRKAVDHVTKGGTLVAEDLTAIARNCDVAARIHRYFQSRKEELARLTKLGRLVDPCRELRQTLWDALEPGGELADSASPDLRRLRRAVQNQHDRLTTRVDQLLQSQRFESVLRDDYFTIREDRYVLPIRIGAKGRVSGIVHAYSSSGQTAFIEPTELVELNNQLRWAQIELQDEINRILEELSRAVASAASSLFRNMEILAYLDVVVAQARFGRLLDASVPTITDRVMELHNARHPLLYLKLEAEKNDAADPRAVPNDIAIEPPRKALIISGPNTGGKTVALKTTGLCAVMIRFGLPIPVDEPSRIPLFESIYTDIGDEQSIDRDLSTFSGHVNNIKGFLPGCDERSLVLLDELFVGTDPVQGASLAVALLEELVRRDTMTVVTTHLEGLKTLAYQSDAFANASMGFDLDTLSPTYRMTMGIPGRSYAVRIASRLGLDKAIIERTEKLLSGQDHQDVEEVLGNLEDQIRQLDEEKRRLQNARRQAEIREQRYKKKYQKLLDRDREELFDETRDLRKKLRQARDLIREELRRLQREKTVEDRERSHRQLHQMQETLHEAEGAIAETREKTRPPDPGPQGLVPVDMEDLEIGMTVYCRPFKREGQILEIDDDAGEARVQIGDLKATVAIEDLYYPSEQSRREHQRGASATDEGRRPSSSGGAAGQSRLLPQTDDNSVDLRGLRVDEALERVDLFLDSAYLKDVGGVYIIHGHGTGALKRAVRGHLPQSRYVDHFRRGERGEGGDGVTIAFLKQQ